MVSGTECVHNYTSKGKGPSFCQHPKTVHYNMSRQWFDNAIVMTMVCQHLQTAPAPRAATPVSQ